MPHVPYRAGIPRHLAPLADDELLMFLVGGPYSGRFVRVPVAHSDLELLERPSLGALQAFLYDPITGAYMEGNPSILSQYVAKFFLYTFYGMEIRCWGFAHQSTTDEGARAQILAAALTMMCMEVFDHG